MATLPPGRRPYALSSRINRSSFVCLSRKSSGSTPARTAASVIASSSGKFCYSWPGVLLGRRFHIGRRQDRQPGDHGTDRPIVLKRRHRVLELRRDDLPACSEPDLDSGYAVVGSGELLRRAGEGRSHVAL